ncbi:MAG TPA: glycosyl transferase family 9 [Xanthomonadaceae bacterium]|nr:glycosyl transferase family 9 [Xanthomonadaceae bacterium]
MPLRYPASLRFPSLRRRAARGLMRWLFGPPAEAWQAPLPGSGIHRILVCHVSHTLGNTLLLTPLLQELERIYPGAEIDIVTRSPIAAQLYGRYFGVARLFHLPAHGAAHLWTVLRQWHRVRAGEYDLAIDTDAQSQTGRLLILWARARFRLGFSGPRKSGRISHPVPVELAPAHKAHRAVFLLAQARGTAAPAHCPPLDIQLDADERQRGQATLERVLAAGQAGGPRRGVIGVFANATGSKRLEQGWWQAFLDRLQALEPHYHLVEIVPASGRSLLGDRYPAFFSNDLRRLGGVLSALDLCVIGDCGVMHLSCAVHTRTLALFVTTDAEEWGPYGALDHVLQARRDDPAAAADAAAEALRHPLAADDDVPHRSWMAASGELRRPLPAPRVACAQPGVVHGPSHH